MKTAIVRISDCAEVIPGYSPKGVIADQPDGTVQVITPLHITKGEPYRYKEQHRLLITPARSFHKYIVEPGHLLFMSRGTNNYAVLVEKVPQPSIAPLTFYILKPRSNAVPGYLAWSLNQDGVKAKLNELRTGAGTPIIPRQEFGDIKIPLPPIELQRKIAALADLQIREKILLQQLLDETDRLHRLLGQRLWLHLENE